MMWLIVLFDCDPPDSKAESEIPTYHPSPPPIITVDHVEDSAPRGIKTCSL